ncbi:FtsW/RodA/SpoVE family cell cycle protein [Alkaliphilus sp. MSJ-5]|uniref:FtsW/RodA/SpoVE family cell cycle protein n=2 Tax=Alkaliphilus flagellatus TaxID=2841507 RepID=A0ABS6G5D1_9FIRM|nr:FtsW/RodA/SpoVE family cell cycle protein [Alkaliphilus flagellatus]
MMNIYNLFKIRRPIYILIIVNLLFFGLLYLYVQPLDYSILAAGGGVIGLMLVSYVVIVKRQMGDQYIFLIISMLTSLGIIMLYRLNPSYGLKQIKIYGLGVILYFLSYIFFRLIKNWDRYIFFYIGFNILLFLATFALGTNIKGATNWINIGGFSFQPAEIIKISFVFFIASYYKLRLSSDEEVVLSKQLYKYKEKIKNVYVFLGLVYMHIFFLLLQRELGISMLFYIVFLSIFYIYEEDQKLLLYNLGLAVVIGILSYFTMSHVEVRLTTWINPWKDISGRGYQITQSLFAIAAGGFFGTGLGLGNPQYIPEVHTDFIFSAICEEMGVFGGMAVVLLYFILTYRGFKIALTIKEPFKKIVALGITLIYGYQTFIIVGGVIKLIPLTGVTLPFISYGGTSLISAFIAFGILQAISKKTLEGEEVALVGE